MLLDAGLAGRERRNIRNARRTLRTEKQPWLNIRSWISVHCRRRGGWRRLRARPKSRRWRTKRKKWDHEVDLAFFDALRTAEENPPPLPPEAKEIAERKNKAEQALKEDQDNASRC